jgi:RNA polymerase sigma factor (sigma-70 family)
LNNWFDGQTISADTVSALPGGSAFPNTSWTLIVAASGATHPDTRAALESLCRGYWYPIYAYVRRHGHSPELSSDLTQDFFLRLLGGNFFERADPQKGRFRNFLLTSLKHFLSDAAGRERALKRGGGLAPLPFEVQDGESIYLREPHHEETPERIFERRWARAVLDRVVATLRDEFVKHGRLDHFNALRSYLMGSGDAPYAELALKLDISESALKSGIHRLRKRYRDLLRAEVASTLADPAELDEELRFLMTALSTKRP